MNNTLSKLQALLHLLTHSNQLTLPNQLVHTLKYLAVALRDNGYGTFSAITSFTKGYIYPRFKNETVLITTQEAVNTLINSPKLDWNNPEVGYTKYVNYAIVKEFNSLTSVEWMGILDQK